MLGAVSSGCSAFDAQSGIRHLILSCLSSCAPPVQWKNTWQQETDILTSSFFLLFFCSDTQSLAHCSMCWRLWFQMTEWICQCTSQPPEKRGSVFNGWIRSPPSRLQKARESHEKLEWIARCEKCCFCYQNLRQSSSPSPSAFYPTAIHISITHHAVTIINHQPLETQKKEITW